MDFVVGLPRTSKLHDSIRVVLDMTKSSHFIPVKSTYQSKDYAKFYIDEIVSGMGSLYLSFRIGEPGSLITFGYLSKRYWVHR